VERGGFAAIQDGQVIPSQLHVGKSGLGFVRSGKDGAAGVGLLGFHTGGGGGGGGGGTTIGQVADPLDP